MKKNTKYIIITGGVLSGLGKGIVSSSIASIMPKDKKIIPIKCDGYLNVDPGTINPIEHGEVFVLEDGGEVDMDFGHYERFIDIDCKSSSETCVSQGIREIPAWKINGEVYGYLTLEELSEITGC